MINSKVLSPSLEEMREENSNLFLEQFKEEPTFISTAPGRINIIGEHTDYTLGKSMTAAINRWVVISFSKRTDSLIQVKSGSYDELYESSVDDINIPQESWKKFVNGAVQLFGKEVDLSHGFNAYITGNVPLGSGVSSSAAIEVALINGLQEMYQSTLDGISIVKICQQIEHQFLGVKCGIMDQYTSYFSKEGYVMDIDYNTLEHQYIEYTSQEWCWVLVNTCVHRELSGSEYTKRVEETQHALEELSVHGITHFREINLKHLPFISNDKERDRIKHYVTANLRVENTKLALGDKNMNMIGAILNESHQSLSNDYEVSCPELDFLAQEGPKIEGCVGSRMMGGGFGGCTINLVKEDAVEEFSEKIQALYKNEFNIDADVQVYEVVNGASVYKY